MIAYWGLIERLKEIKKIVSAERESNDELYEKLEDLWIDLKEEMELI